jgi:hypothetical protein
VRRLPALGPLLCALLWASAPTLGAQTGTGTGTRGGATAGTTGDTTAPQVREPAREAGARAQGRFENYRRANLPASRGGSPRDCQERVGRFCYWYDEDGEVPTEPPEVTAARLQLVRTLDSLARAEPEDSWVAGQRVKYLDEAGRNAEALAAAQECRAWGWWCDALQGFALHQLGRYPEAEAAWERVLAAMSPGERCAWTDLSLYLELDMQRQYRRNSCGTPQRDAYEARVWWFARSRYAMKGNDARSEHFARLTYAEFIRAAPSVYMFGFDEDERELLLRFGWPRAWSRGPSVPSQMGGPQFSIVGHDPIPAYRYIPPMYVMTTPTVSDSTDWAVQLPPVVARYQPPFAKRLLMLEHQQGLFRRGDTALVVLAYDVSKVEGLEGASLEAGLVLTPGGEPRPSETVLANAPAKGTITVRAPWSPLLMSAEIAAHAQSTLVRARYGIRPPFAQGTRVSLSDLLFYTPYGSFPTTVEEVLPHALATQKVRSSQPLGVFWEAYNTNPAGEPMTISLTVVPETEEAGGLRRAAQALRLARRSAPVSITVEDFSARGVSTSARAVQLDISTLRRGEYLVQLEITVAGQYTIRADRRIVVVGP